MMRHPGKGILVAPGQRGTTWLYLERPFVSMPSAEMVARYGVTITPAALQTVRERVSRQKAAQATTPEDWRASFDVPYALELRADGSLIAVYEAVGRSWVEICGLLKAG